MLGFISKVEGWVDQAASEMLNHLLHLQVQDRHTHIGESLEEERPLR